MKQAKGTHKSMGSKGSKPSLSDGVAETMAVKKPDSTAIGETGRQKAVKLGTVAAK